MPTGWDIPGAHAGGSYFGTAVFVNGEQKIYSQPGAPNASNVTFDPIRQEGLWLLHFGHRGALTFSDSNTI